MQTSIRKKTECSLEESNPGTTFRLLAPMLYLLTIGDQWEPGARFSKVAALYRPFSGVTISFVSQERRGFKSSNFTVILLFVTLKRY